VTQRDQVQGSKVCRSLYQVNSWWVPLKWQLQFAANFMCALCKQHDPCFRTPVTYHNTLEGWTSLSRKRQPATALYSAVLACFIKPACGCSRGSQPARSAAQADAGRLSSTVSEATYSGFCRKVISRAPYTAAAATLYQSMYGIVCSVLHCVCSVLHCVCS